MKMLLSADLVAEQKAHILGQVDRMRGRREIPKLVSVVCSDDLSVMSYVKSKQKTANALGIPFEIKDFCSVLDLEELLTKLHEIYHADEIGGVIVELPLKKGIDELAVLNSIPFQKDVDGMGAVNLGALCQGLTGRQYSIPATPQACMMLARSVTEIAGKNVALIGRGRTVGKPLANLLISEGATVTVCHSRTANIRDIARSADIVFTATGIPKKWDASYFKDGSIIVDAGIGFVDAKISGDTDVEALEGLDGWVTPVPGGVGPLTAILLFQNFLKLVDFE